MLRRGEPEGEIREALEREGYSKEDIDAAFKPHHYDMRSWYLFFAVTVSLIGLYLFVMNRGLLLLICGILLFIAYFYESKRLKDLEKFK